MNCAGDIVDKFVKRSEETEELCETRSDGDSNHGVPDEKSNNGMFSNGAFFPSDSGVCKIGDNSSNGGGNEV